MDVVGGEGGEPRVVLDGVHVPVAETVTQDGGGIAGSGADLQHLLALADTAEIEHAHDQGGQGARRGGTAAERARGVGGVDPVDLGDPGGVLVDEAQPSVFADPVAVHGLPPGAGRPEQAVAEEQFAGNGFD